MTTTYQVKPRFTLKLLCHFFLALILCLFLLLILTFLTNLTFSFSAFLLILILLLIIFPLSEALVFFPSVSDILANYLAKKINHNSVKNNFIFSIFFYLIEESK